MRDWSAPAGVAIVFLIALAGATPPAGAGGFELSTQSSKGMAMGGAFVAAAEDPSALFYNVGALAFLDQKALTVTAGVAARNLNQSLYQGLPPGIGVGRNGEEKTGQTFIPHAYAALPLGESGTIGFGVYSPFGFDVRWADEDNFAGRFIALDSKLETIDVASGVAYQVTPTLGVGAGIVYRTSELSLLRRLASFDPAAGQVADVASLRTEATLDDGLGWTAGLLIKVGEALSIGASYRSPIEIDYDGEARFTQIPTGNAGLDALIAATVPIDQDLSFRTRIEFPETTSLGIAYALNDAVQVEVDTNWTAWSSFQSLDLILPNNSEFDTALPQGYADSTSYRLGVRVEAGGGSVLRFGLAIEESPQPDEALGPLFPDAERISYSAGFSMDWLDIAFVWLDAQERQTVVNSDGFNGKYNSNAWILGLTINL